MIELKKSNIVILIILFVLSIIVSINFNIVDSDSGKEISRALYLIDYNKIDNGPLVSQSIYSIFLLVNPTYFIFLIKILNPILLILTIIFSVKILDNFNANEYNKFIFIFLFLSAYPIFLLFFFPKPYLLVTLFLILSFYYFSSYIKNRQYHSLFFSSIFLSVSVLVKNHAYVFLPYPFVFLMIKFLKKRKIDFKALIPCLIPLTIILIPYLIVSLMMFGIKFWHFPNSWFYSEGLSSYIASNFWRFPKQLTYEYFLGHKDFLIKTIPLFGLSFLFFIDALKRNKEAFKFFSILLILSILPFAFGLMPFYQEYNYLISLILIFTISLSFGIIEKNSYVLHLSSIIIFLISFMLISSNIIDVININKNSKEIIVEYNEFEKQNNPSGVMFARDFKLQPYTKNKLLFIGIDNLEKEDIVNILSTKKNYTYFDDSLKKNNINYLLFYKNKTYNELYYNVLMSFFDLDFSMEKFKQSPLLEKVYEGKQIIIFRYKNEISN